MSKYACRDCDTTFTAPTDTDTVRCPGCGDMVEQQPAASSPPPDQTADRAAVLLEARDVARAEAERLEMSNHDARAARGARSVAYLLRRLAAEAQQSEPGPVARVRALHQPDGNGECQHCHHSAPCPTITALDGAEAQQQPDTETPVGYSGKGRVWCLRCPRPADEDVPVTVDVLQPYELCPSCGRHVVDVARALADKGPRP